MRRRQQVQATYIEDIQLAYARGQKHWFLFYVSFIDEVHSLNERMSEIRYSSNFIKNIDQNSQPGEIDSSNNSEIELKISKANQRIDRYI